MATNFPSSLDSFTNPTDSDTLDSPNHASQHADVNDAVEAIELALLDGAPLKIDDTNERVGIGTASPDDKLHVVGDVTIEVTDDGSAAQPEVTLHRGSASPADGDYLGQVKFSGKNDAGQTVNYAKITGKISDVTDGTEDGLIEIANINAGSQSIGYRFTSSDLKLLNGRGLQVDGNVGIGTTSPQAPLHVSSTAGEGVRIQKSNNDQQGSYIGMWDDDQRLGYIGYAGNDDLYLENEASAGKTFLSTNGSVRLAIDSTGNVGIGTTTPSHLLTVSGDIQIDDGSPALFMTDTDTGATSRLHASSTQGSVFLEADINDEVANTNIGFKSDGVQRMTINSSGSVGIGTTSPGSMLDVRGGVQTHRILPFADNTYDLGANVLRWDDVYATNGTINTSDERDKSNIKDIDLGLEFVNDLRPVTYTWDDRGGVVGTRTHMGFVAQEVATALGNEASSRSVWINSPAEQRTDPETGEVDEGRDIQGLRYNELMAPMVKAIQELTARIEALEIS